MNFKAKHISQQGMRTGKLQKSPRGNYQPEKHGLFFLRQEIHVCDIAYFFSHGPWLLFILCPLESLIDCGKVESHFDLSIEANFHLCLFNFHSLLTFYNVRSLLILWYRASKRWGVNQDYLWNAVVPMADFTKSDLLL